MEQEVPEGQHHIECKEQAAQDRTSEEHARQCDAASQGKSETESPEHPSPNKADVSAYETARTLVLVGSAVGVGSLFFGGALASCVGLAAASIGGRKMFGLAKKSSEVGVAASQSKKTVVLAIVFCCLAAILNLVSVYLVYPSLIDSGAIQAPTTAQQPSGSAPTWG